jgi:hypothetical protein
MTKILITIAKPNTWWPGHQLIQFLAEVPRRTVVDSLFIENKAKELGHTNFLTVGFVLYTAPAAEQLQEDNPVK